MLLLVGGDSWYSAGMTTGTSCHRRCLLVSTALFGTVIVLQPAGP